MQCIIFSAVLKTYQIVTPKQRFILNFVYRCTPKKYWFSVKSILIYMHLHYLEVVVSNV